MTVAWPGAWGADGHVPSSCCLGGGPRGWVPSCSAQAAPTCRGLRPRKGIWEWGSREGACRAGGEGWAGLTLSWAAAGAARANRARSALGCPLHTVPAPP